MAYKSATVIVITEAEIALELSFAQHSKLVLSLLKKVWSLASNIFADPGRKKDAGMFGRWRVPITIFYNAQQVEKCKCKLSCKLFWCLSFVKLRATSYISCMNIMKCKRHLNMIIKIINIEDATELAKCAIKCIIIAITNCFQNIVGIIPY